MDEKIINEELETVDAAAEEAAVDEAKASDEVKASETAVEEEVGNIKISVDVVSTIAGIAASEIKGVADMYTSFANEIAGRFGGKKNQNKGVRVEMNGDSVTVDLYIVVAYGVRIPELAWEIQESVKTNIETMTGLTVEKVNIHIEGVSFTKAEPVTELIEEAEED